MPGLAPMSGVPVREIGRDQPIYRLERIQRTLWRVSSMLQARELPPDCRREERADRQLPQRHRDAALGGLERSATRPSAEAAEAAELLDAVLLDDFHALQPFHWGYEFDEVMNERGASTPGGFHLQVVQFRNKKVKRHDRHCRSVSV
jgi:hypothetical protein